MTDLLDKAILFGMGVEKRIGGIVESVIDEGRSKGGGDGETEESLEPVKEFENRIVEEAVCLLRDLVIMARGGKATVDSEIKAVAEKIVERCSVATKEEMEVIKKMSQVAREKVDTLEKRLDKLERKIEEGFAADED